MKRRVFRIFFIILTVFLLHACASHKPLEKTGRGDFPSGHDMNPSTVNDPNEEYNMGGLEQYS